MSKKDHHNDDLDLFKQAVEGIKPLKQDKLSVEELKAPKCPSQQQRDHLKQQERQRIQASFQFSDGFEAHFDPNQPMKYAKDKTFSGEVKRLRRGEYAPEMTVDLHGYNREDAKWELAAFLHEAKKQHYYCVCIVHGIGSRVLKQQIPNWLVQHPDVLGFHEAPLEWGGKGALLVLVEHPEHVFR